jgi:carbonic anhydrase/acetyltransferase-like protein (isoleucine patch superfamily)
MEVAKYSERLVPTSRFVAVDGVAPLVAEYGTFIAPSASVIGSVIIGRNSR